MIGKANKTAIDTLVERSSGYAMLVHLPEGRKPEQVASALAAKDQHAGSSPGCEGCSLRRAAYHQPVPKGGFMESVLLDVPGTAQLRGLSVDAGGVWAATSRAVGSYEARICDRRASAASGTQAARESLRSLKLVKRVPVAHGRSAAR
jgi:hypothetical protein